MSSGTLSIFHISDLHWSEAKVIDIEIVRDALISDIKEMKGLGHALDICIFNRDLVVGGQDRDLFKKAFKAFIQPILDTAKIPRDRFSLFLETMIS
jgi:hypothetical protein